MSVRSLTIRALLAVLGCCLLMPAAAGAQLPLGLTPGRVEIGMFSPPGDAAAERAAAPLRMRFVYVTGAVRKGSSDGMPADGGRGLQSFLDESDREQMLPVLTYYKLQPSGPARLDEFRRARSVLRTRSTMTAYWKDVRATLQIAGRNPSQRVVLQVEPDGWEYIDQVRGTRTRVIVGSSGLSELRGLKNDGRGFMAAFVRLRDRYAPNVALGWHLSAWGVGQLGTSSIANSTHVGELRASFYKALGGSFDVIFHDPAAEPFDTKSWAEHLAFLTAFHAAVPLPIVEFQVTTGDLDWLLAPNAAARARMADAAAAGVQGILWDAGTPQAPRRRAKLLSYSADYYASLADRR